jgi:hypothetical protein
MSVSAVSQVSAVSTRFPQFQFPQFPQFPQFHSFHQFPQFPRFHLCSGIDHTEGLLFVSPSLIEERSGMVFSLDDEKWFGV